MLAAMVKDGIVAPEFCEGKIFPPFLTMKISPRNSPVANPPPPCMYGGLEGTCLLHSSRKAYVHSYLVHVKGHWVPKRGRDQGVEMPIVLDPWSGKTPKWLHTPLLY